MASSSPTSAPLVDINTLKFKRDHPSSHSHSHSRLSFKEVVSEMKMLYKIAFPMMLTGLLLYGKSLISMVFLGKLGKNALAGGSLGMGIANITGYSIIYGLALGMEGISSQAYGAKQWSLMSQTLQRTLLILLLACIPISFLWLNIHPLLLLCNQDPSISSVASTYLTFSLPDLIFHSLIDPLKIHLRAQNVTLPLISSAAFSLILHAPINYFLVTHLSLGLPGVALSVSLSDLLLLLALLPSMPACLLFQFHCFDFDDDWRSILKLALPSCFSICLEWWWYEIMILLSGILSNASDAVATMGILIQATSFIYIFPSSLSLAASTRVGNELGANQPARARVSSAVAMMCGVLTSLAATWVMVAVGGVWGRAFTDDAAVVALTAAVMPVVGLCELGNCPQTTGCGVLRGSARPSVGAHINVGSFYGVGLPLAVFMGFFMKMGLLGLWLGLLGAQIVCAGLMVSVLSRTNWVVEANRARQLIGVEEFHRGLTSI